MMLAINRQVTGFAMPGLEIPEFKAKAIEIAKAGIYDLRIHHDEVVLPVLFTHWKIDQVTGLSDEAEQARDGISELPLDARRDGDALRGEARGPRVGLTALPGTFERTRFPQHDEVGEAVLGVRSQRPDQVEPESMERLRVGPRRVRRVARLGCEVPIARAEPVARAR